MPPKAGALSSLAKQLGRLAQGEHALGAASIPSKFQASFLFAEKEAADYDIEAIFMVGRSGFDELVRLDPSFSRYELLLFADSLKETDRALMTKAENLTLDGHLRTFLRLLSPYFLQKAAHKALEWLIRRFRINELNSDALIECILPYHDTPQFVRMVQIIYFTQNDKWGFLFDIKKHGSSLRRSAILQRCLIDRTIVGGIFEAVAWYAKRYDELCTKPATYISFFVLLLCEYVARVEKAEENLVFHLMPIIVSLIKMKGWPDAQVAGFMVCAKLLGRVELADEALQELLLVSAKDCAVQNQANHLTFVAMLLQASPTLAISEKAANFIIKYEELSRKIIESTRKYDVSYMVRKLVLAFLPIAKRNIRVWPVLRDLANSELIDAETRAHIEAGTEAIPNAPSFSSKRSAETRGSIVHGKKIKQK